MHRALVYVGLGLGILLLVAVFPLFLLAIWNTNGQDDQWGATAFLCFMTGGLLTIAAGLVLDLGDDS